MKISSAAAPVATAPSPQATMDTYLERIWDEILVPMCGADAAYGPKFEFVDAHAAEGSRIREYRFQGSLGFGGKFRIGINEPAKVDMYPEDSTPARDKSCADANTALNLLYQELFEPK